MNGFTMMAESYKKLMDEGKIAQAEADKEIRIYNFLAGCDDDDFCRIIDTGAFNEIIRAYCRQAVNNAEIGDDEKSKVVMQLRGMFDEKTAKKVLNDGK